MEKSRIVASRLVGKAKKAVAAFRGDTGIFGALEADHGELRNLIRQIAKTSDTASGVSLRVDLFDRMKRELIAHLRAEEEVFYDLLKQHDETRRRTLHSLGEHQELDELLRRVHSIDPSELGWMTMFERLKEAFENHIAQEEHKLFPQAKRLLTREQVHTVDEQFQSAKRRQLRLIAEGAIKPGQHHAPPSA
jgi:iron-sulfur cluster repair protein YtfE (RIC family)